MTESRDAAARPRKQRLSRRILRTWAWILGGLSFLSPWALLGLHPKPAVAAAPPVPQPKPRRVIHRVIRRIVYSAPKSNSGGGGVNYVYASGGGSSGGSAPATTTRGS